MFLKPKKIRFQIDDTVGGSMFKYPGKRAKFPTKTMMQLAKKASQYPEKHTHKARFRKMFPASFLGKQTDKI